MRHLVRPEACLRAYRYSHTVVTSGPLREQTTTASKRLTKATAHKLIGALVGT